MTTEQRIAFLEARRNGIGSSDVAKILGVSRWGTAIDVYLDKIESPVISEKMAAPLEWGIRSEPIIAAAISDYHGWVLTKPNPSTKFHAEYPFLAASPDRINDSGELIEIKTSGRVDGWGEPETDDIPQQYWLQCQHQLAVWHSHDPSVEVCWVFVLISQCDFRRYYIRRDAEYLPSVLPALQDFWTCVENRTPPAPDFEHMAAIASLNRLYKPRPGTFATLDDSAATVADEYARLGAVIKDAEGHRDSCKAALIAHLGDHETGLLPDGREIVRKIEHRKEYTVAATSFPKLLIKKAKLK